MHKITRLLTLVVSLFNMQAYAQSIWSDNSLSLLQGQNYSDFGNNNAKQTVMTLEHTSKHQWGGLFYFVDSTTHHDRTTNNHDIYGEFSPALSLSYITGDSLTAGIIKDIKLAGTYEFGGGSHVNNYLLGFGLDWQLPGFDFFNTTLFHAFNNNDFNLKDDQQLTIVWGAKLPISSLDVTLNGYIDWSSAASDHKADLHINPQLLVNISKALNISQTKIEAGIEYSYWHNKYGNNGLATENNISLITKWHF